jgi:hypothetical protein
VKELYDEASITAVLSEWFRTFQDLPLIIRQSVQLGLFSSAQLVRFLCMDVRPGLTRKVTRVLSPKVPPPSLSVQAGAAKEGEVQVSVGVKAMTSYSLFRQEPLL